MAKEYIVKDDIDGSAGAETHKLSLDGNTVTIDLAKGNFDKLSKALEPFFKAGTVTVKANGNGGDSELTAIREWATANGHQVAAKGRISQDVVDAYHKANPAPAAPAK